MKIVSLDDCINTKVSHNSSIKKQVFLSNTDAPNITQFARAIFPANEVASVHAHSDMSEVFYVESGIAEVTIEGASIRLTPGSTLLVSAGEQHELRNKGPHPLSLLYFGVLI